MYGDKALELLTEFNRRGSNIAPFNEDGVRKVLAETKQLFEANQRDVASAVEGGESSLVTSVHFRHACLERNRRCLLAYLTARLAMLRRYRWEFGSILPPDVRANVSELEAKWLNNYSRNLASYMGSIGNGAGLDLTQDIQPPKSVYVEVRCLQEYGEYELEATGDLIALKKNSTHLLPRAEAEPLIRRGILQHIQ